jgi:uncharacterized protein
VTTPYGPGMAKSAIPQDVDAYIAAADPDARPILQELRELIRSAVPGVEERISYGVPFYKHHGELGGFAAYTRHVSFGFGSDVLQAGDRAALEAGGYKLGKGTMQIRFDQDVPAPEIRQILEAKARMNEAEPST